MVKQVKLTKQLIMELIRDREIRPGAGYVYKDADEGTLRVRKTVKAITFDWRNPAPKPGEVASQRLGTFPCDIELMRQKARRLNRLRDEGEEITKPEAKPAKVKTADSIEGLFRIYFRSVKFSQLKRGPDIQRTLRRGFLDKYGARKSDSFTYPELDEWQRSFKGDASAALAHGALYGGISWLEKAGLITRGMFPRVQSRKHEPDIQPLPIAEYRALWRASLKLDDKLAGARIRALMLSGQRSDAILGARWDELLKDGNGDYWLKIPYARSKGGFEYHTPISSELMALFVKFGIRDGEFIFKPHAGAKTTIAFNVKEKVCKLMARDLGREPTHFRFHDLRKNFRNMLSELSVNDYTAELLIGHKIKHVSQSGAIYLKRDFSAEKVDAMNKITAQILKICEGDEIEFAAIEQKEMRQVTIEDLEKLRVS